MEELIKDETVNRIGHVIMCDICKVPLIISHEDDNGNYDDSVGKVEVFAGMKHSSNEALFENVEYSYTLHLCVDCFNKEVKRIKNKCRCHMI